jgi:hypothetical protein
MGPMLEALADEGVDERTGSELRDDAMALDGWLLEAEPTIP